MDMNVVGSKIALLVFNVSKNKCSLVVIRKGEHVWEENTLACFSQASFPMPSQNVTGFLAADGDWISVTKWPSKQVSLWQDDTYRQDIDLPGLPSIARDIPFFIQEPYASAMYSPFLILSVGVRSRASIKVFRLAADNEMKDISTVASLIKSISLGDCSIHHSRIIFNQLFFGFVLRHARTGLAVTFIEKRTLVDTGIAETERRQIKLMDRLSHSCVDMNSTSLVFTLFQRRYQDPELVLKNDFWMDNNTQ